MPGQARSWRPTRLAYPTAGRGVTRSVPIRHVSIRVVRLHVAAGRLPLGQDDLRPGDLFVGYEAQEVGDAIETGPSLFIGIHHVPGGLRSIGRRHHCIPGSRVVVPPAVRFQVHRTQLPDLASVGDAILNAPGLLFLADFEPELDQDHAGGDHGVLEGDNVLEELLHLRVRRVAYHPLDPGAVVPTAVEDHDLTRRRKMREITLDV